MISSISLKNVWDIEEYKFLSELPALQFLKEGKLNFTSGLNILHAPNGAGKSTILKVMADVTASYQGGVSCFTSGWATEPIVKAVKRRKSPLEWDGCCVMYSNPRNAVGLFSGGAAFDDDFFMHGLRNIMSKSSTGLTTLERQTEVFEVLLGKKKFPSVTNKLGYEPSFIFAENIAEGNPTIILDEPDSGFSLEYQSKIFNLFQKGANNGFQIIIATHSPFGLLLDGNHIDLVEGHSAKELGTIIDYLS